MWFQNILQFLLESISFFNPVKYYFKGPKGDAGAPGQLSTAPGPIGPSGSPGQKVNLIKTYILSIYQCFISVY